MSCQLISISDDGYLSLMDDSGDIREDLKVPEGELGSQLRADFENGRSLLVGTFCVLSITSEAAFIVIVSYQCTVLKAVGEEMVIALKQDTSADK